MIYQPIRNRNCVYGSHVFDQIKMRKGLLIEDLPNTTSCKALVSNSPVVSGEQSFEVSTNQNQELFMVAMYQLHQDKMRNFCRQGLTNHITAKFDSSSPSNFKGDDKNVTLDGLIWFIVFNITFNNISFIL